MANQRDLKAFVRYDGSGRVVAGSLVLRKKKPKVGRWEEILTYECCNPTTTTTTTSGGTTTTTSSTSTSTTTTTTTSSVQQYRISATGCQGCPNGCSEDLNSGTFVYAQGPAYATPRQLYTDSGLTTPFIANAGNYKMMQGWPSGQAYSVYSESGQMLTATICQ
jgi:hypothetical protein